MATYDDYDGVYFSAQAIRLYHPEVTDRTEIVVVDNHPSGPCAGPLKDLEHLIPGYRYVPYERTQGTAVRDLVFREANAEFVLCMDSHVLFPPGALARLMAYISAHRDSPDLLQGPLLSDNLQVYGTHFDPVWRAAMYGVWAMDTRGLDPEAAPFQIGMQGLGVFACRRSAWPGLNPRLRGFGGEEGYIHEKFRRAGGRTLCLPFLGWVHRFGRPFGPRYGAGVEDRLRNYLLVHDELGLDPGPAIDHFEREFGAERMRPVVDRVLAELRGPFHFFDAIYALSFDPEGGGWESLVRQCRALGIDHRLRRFDRFAVPGRPRLAQALSHRAVVAEAKLLNLGNVLVLEDDVVFSRGIADVLRASLSELAGRSWALLHLDAPGTPPDAPCGHLATARAPGSLRAVAYHQGAYERILAEVPDSPTALARWLETRGDIGQHYAHAFAGAAAMTCPPVATGADALAREARPFDPLPVSA